MDSICYILEYPLAIIFLRVLNGLGRCLTVLEQEDVYISL